MLIINAYHYLLNFNLAVLCFEFYFYVLFFVNNKELKIKKIKKE
jgi:hypothetical protein